MGHYGVKNTTELYQGLASICQSGKKTPQAFLMRALDLRQKILSASQEGEDSLKYDAEHIKQLFCRTVETGLQDQGIRSRLRPYLSNPQIADEELIHQLNVAVSAEEERGRKLKGQSKVKPTYITHIGQEVEPPSESPRKTPSQKQEPSQKKAKADFQELRAEIEALKTEMKSKPRESSLQGSEGRGRWTGRGRRDSRPRPVKCRTCTEKGAEWCNHCLKCGSDNHYAVGCRQGESAGPKSLNGNRLLMRDQK